MRLPRPGGRGHAGMRPPRGATPESTPIPWNYRVWPPSRTMLYPEYPTTMAKDEIKTTIDSDGLRYRSKPAGSPFGSAGAFTTATMSCFLCGKHRPRASLKGRKLLGRTQFVCAPSCKELADAENKKG